MIDKGLQISAEDILNSMFNPDETVYFRAVPEKKQDDPSVKNISCKCGRYKDIEEELKTYNEVGKAIFYIVNYGGGKDEEITRVNAQFIDMDKGTFEEQEKKVEGFPLKPSMIIKTHKSLHVYWFMDDTARVDRFTDVQNQLVKYFDSCPACVNKSRALRLPGFMHNKTDEPVEVTCVDFHPERKYSQDQLSEVLPDIEEAKPVERKDGKDKGLSVVMKRCDFLQHCKEDAATLSEPDWYAMITNLAVFEGGTDLIHELSKPYPQYSETKTQRKINHFWESGTGPITCKKICEDGFDCPKFKAGECGVKSPSALCTKELSTTDLTEMIKNLPITNEPVDDTITARNFIKKYLYNQDVAVAEIIIKTTLKLHFKFQASEIQPLISVYREEHKAYSAGKGAQKNTENTSIPIGYEVTENGLCFHPGVLAQYLTENQNVIFSAGQYYRYQDGVYQEMNQMEVQRLVQKNMLVEETRMSQITDTEKQWQLQILKEVRELNPNPYVINVRNGLYNVQTGKLEDHTPAYLSTIQLNVSYDETADCPKFKKFLNDSMEGDSGQVNLLQEVIGYCLIPVTYAQKCILLCGAGGAGKSVLLNVIEDLLLGQQNVSNVSWQALNERFKTAELFGKLANIFADLPTQNIEDNGIFKALVGEDYLTVEKKNKDPFSFKNTARLLFSCNSIPKNYGDRSEGFYRRLIIIRFNRSVKPEDRDPKLLDKFREEANGIFLFALEGLRRLIKNDYHFSETEVNRKELQKYREDSDSVLSFVRDYCELRKDGSVGVGSSELYEQYEAYCKKSGQRPCAQKEFVSRLKTSFDWIKSDKDKLRKHRTLVGIRFKDDLDDG